jgi:hypothetical protein
MFPGTPAIPFLVLGGAAGVCGVEIEEFSRLAGGFDRKAACRSERQSHKGKP